MTLEDYVKSVSHNSHLKRIAISLFQFLDKANRGSISFETLLKRVTPGATDDDISRMMGWINEEEE